MKSARNISVLRPCVFEALENRQLMAAGALDLSFNGTGKTFIPFDLGSAIPHVLEGRDVTVQGDGKVVVAGIFRRADNTGPSDFAVARFNFDGTIDTSFGVGGLSRVHVGKSDGKSAALTVAIQTDGKILAAGQAKIARRFASDTTDFAVVRFNRDGTRDNTFDGDGIRTIQLSKFSFATDIAIQSNGRIIVAGNALDDGANNFALVRLFSNGATDKSFNGNGTKRIDFGGIEAARAVAIDGNGNSVSNPNFGKIVVVGESSFGSGSFAIARLNSNGTPDSTFGSNGQLLSPFTGLPKAEAKELLIQSNGKFIVTGFAKPGGASRFVMARFGSDGNIDRSFGSTGAGTVDGLGMNSGEALLRTSDGGFVVGGSENGRFVIAGFTADGVLKNNFGTNGKTITDFGDSDLGVMGLARGPGRRIVAAGGKQFRTARYLDEGANVVSIGTFDTKASESGDTSTIIVGRSENLPVPTRVFLSFGGTATAPVILNRGDYLLDGVSNQFGLFIIGGGVSTPFVDIPAGQSFTTFTLKVNKDAVAEPVETAKFTIVPDAAYTISNSSSTTINIFENDGSPNKPTPGANPGPKSKIGLFSSDLIGGLV